MVPIACAENVPVSSNRAQGMEYSYSVIQLFKSAVLSDSLSDCKYVTMIHIEIYLILILWLTIINAR